MRIICQFINILGIVSHTKICPQYIVKCKKWSRESRRTWNILCEPCLIYSRDWQKATQVLTNLAEMWKCGGHTIARGWSQSKETWLRHNNEAIQRCHKGGGFFPDYLYPLPIPQHPLYLKWIRSWEKEFRFQYKYIQNCRKFVQSDFWPPYVIIPNYKYQKVKTQVWNIAKSTMYLAMTALTK